MSVKINIFALYVINTESPIRQKYFYSYVVGSAQYYFALRDQLILESFYRWILVLFP